MLSLLVTLFFFNATPTTEIYTLSLHDALPISGHDETTRFGLGGSDDGRWLVISASVGSASGNELWLVDVPTGALRDRKSTRLNSSHSQISYAVFCLKKKIKTEARTSSHSFTRD